MKRLLWLIATAARHPIAATWGVAEFRSDLTRHYDDPVGESYDSGRELAHMVTGRRYEA